MHRRIATNTKVRRTSPCDLDIRAMHRVLVEVALEQDARVQT